MTSHGQLQCAPIELIDIHMNLHPISAETSQRAVGHSEAEHFSEYHQAAKELEEAKIDVAQANAEIELERGAIWSYGDSVRRFHPFIAVGLGDLIDHTTVEVELERENAGRHAEFLVKLDKLLAPSTLTVAEVVERAANVVDSTGVDLLVHRIVSVLNLPGTNVTAGDRIVLRAEAEGYPPQYFAFSTASGTVDGTRALPVEILTTIFTLLRESMDGDLTGLATLIKVCSRWRDVCVRTSSLWGGTLYFPRIQPQFMATVFKRSIARPLSITLDLLGISHPVSLPPAPRASSVAECTRQWRERMVRHPPPQPQSPFYLLTRVQERLESLILNLRPGDIIINHAGDPGFARLTSLALFVMDVDGGEEGWDVEEAEGGEGVLDGMLDFFQNSPALEAFALTAYAPYSLRLRPRALDFPWSQLTSLSIFIEMSGDDVYDILVQCTKLQECRLGHVENYESDQESHEIPTLTSLEFTIADYAYVLILEVFKFPRLQSLTFTAHDDFCPVDDIIHCSPHGLLKLDLSTCSIEVQALTRLLQHLPYLEELTLTDCSTADAFPFLELFVYETAPHPLYNLTRLKIGHISDTIDGHFLVRMIDSLWSHRNMAQAPFPSIRTVELDLNGSRFPHSVETALGRMSAKGYLVDFGTPQYQGRAFVLERAGSACRKGALLEFEYCLTEWMHWMHSERDSSIVSNDALVKRKAHLRRHELREEITGNRVRLESTEYERAQAREQE
ncbi:hypothetical protein FB45DRAFT_859257 [Roridomyces roridus]|uniref:F-box domain-containing protein n=1 Tax=Roridomyces roridus TaxID=1738132 RepID=A0AAD7CJF9_9AGAR|nr:hypothetical protein FB45DRAFT_859257 [Roridomyces roridus]